MVLVVSTIHYRLRSAGFPAILRFGGELVISESLGCLNNVVRSIRFEMSLRIPPSPRNIKYQYGHDNRNTFTHRKNV